MFIAAIKSYRLFKKKRKLRDFTLYEILPKIVEQKINKSHFLEFNWSKYLLQNLISQIPIVLS